MRGPRIDGSLVDRVRFRVGRTREVIRHPSGVGEVRSLEVGGHRVRLWIGGPIGAPAVLLSPDPPNVIEHHAPHLDRLAKELRTVCVELPGFGRSVPAEGFGFSLGEMAEVVLGVIDALALGPTVLGFSCIAGLGAIEAASRRPAAVRGLLLAQTPSLEDALLWAERVDVRGMIGTPVVGQLLVRALRRSVARGWYRAALPRGADAQPYLEPALAAFDAGADFCLASALQSLKREPREVTPVEVPAVVLFGEADRTHRRSRPERLLSRLPRVRVERLPGVGHFPDLEAPDRFARLALELAS